jgi:hypothetical protein
MDRLKVWRHKAAGRPEEYALSETSLHSPARTELECRVHRATKPIVSRGT